MPTQTPHTPPEQTMDFSYDQTPYISYPFAQSTPETLNTIAGIFGLDAPPVAHARILELGCAAGNNLIPIAERYPDAECVGVDLSSRQIADGNEVVKALGLKNISLHAMSIADITDNMGVFDYIICHGVFSWVPEFVQQAIFRLCTRQLTANGVAYVSYNTLPGWNMVRSLRELMIYHTNRFPDHATKAAQARAILQFIRDGNANNPKSTYAEVVENELKLLSAHSDSYLLHEHLEEHNTQFYFHDFMTLAGQHGLQYLGDANLTSMYTGNFPEATAKILQASNDIIRTEQYMDFLTNRRFRSTLLCHKGRILRRNLLPEQFHDVYITTAFNIPESMQDYDWQQPKAVEFPTKGTLKLSTGDLVLVAAICVLAEEPRAPIHIARLVKQTAAKLRKHKIKLPAAQEPALMDALLNHILRFMFVGGFTMSSEPPSYQTVVSAEPVASPLVRYQAARQAWATNLRHECVALTPFDKALLPMLDGSRLESDMVADLLSYFKAGALTMSDNNVAITDMAKVKKRLPAFVSHMLVQYARNAMLVR